MERNQSGILAPDSYRNIYRAKLDISIRLVWVIDVGGIQKAKSGNTERSDKNETWLVRNEVGNGAETPLLITTEILTHGESKSESPDQTHGR